MTLAESVAGALGDAIRRGDYLSGERLAELHLAHEMNVSQNTARDALYLLEQQGLVTKVARQGVFVRTYDSDEIAEVYALWSSVESLALNWMLPLARNVQKQLQQVIDEARQRNQTGQTGMLLFDFHRQIGQAAGKPQTLALLKNLLNQVQILENMRQRRAPRTREQFAEQIDTHQDLLETMKRKDLTAAHTTLRAFIQAECESLLKIQQH
ncbi:MAG: GntR family transcriptional regulator [Anaerolineae bacterium]|nr:GntR family transcriptional regulator [Anaerolineae bacterium]